VCVCASVPKELHVLSAMSVQDGQGLGLSGTASSARHVTYFLSTNAPNRQHGVTWSAGNLPCSTTLFSSSKKIFILDMDNRMQLLDALCETYAVEST
jgi:hypothetical protein